MVYFQTTAKSIEVDFEGVVCQAKKPLKRCIFLFNIIGSSMLYVFFGSNRNQYFS